MGIYYVDGHEDEAPTLNSVARVINAMRWSDLEAMAAGIDVKPYKLTGWAKTLLEHKRSLKLAKEEDAKRAEKKSEGKNNERPIQ